MPGSLVTMERRVPVKRLKSVDLPTLGRPTMTRDGRFSAISSWAGHTMSAVADCAIFQCSAFERRLKAARRAADTGHELNVQRKGNEVRPRGGRKRRQLRAVDRMIKRIALDGNATGGADKAFEFVA